MIPNYKKIVRMERERYRMHGLAIKFPARKAPEVKIIYKTKEVPKEVVREKIVEKIVYKDRIVDKIVEVEKPIYIEKIVEKPIYIQAQSQ
jgi:superfamily I DNA and/or RNA helicase